MYKEWTETDYQNKYYHINQKLYIMCREWNQTDYQHQHYNMNQKNEGTKDDRGRDGGTNYMFEEQGTGNSPKSSGT